VTGKPSGMSRQRVGDLLERLVQDRREVSLHWRARASKIALNAAERVGCVGCRPAPNFVQALSKDPDLT